MLRVRAAAIGALLGSAFVLGGSAGTPWVRAADASRSAELTATLDGVPIPLADVSKYYCDDFAYPIITCSVSKTIASVRMSALALLSSVEYVTVYEKAGYGGASLSVSQDYPSLLVIGWNDRISSFRARNGETGEFTTDWLYGGSSWPFCCNSQVNSLGAYDNTFSSVQRT